MVDVIIPTYKPDKDLLQLLAMLKKQSVSIHEIQIVNTQEKLWEQWLLQQSMDQQKMLEEYPNLVVYHIEKTEFDHAGTRQRAIDKSNAEYTVLMTMDAIPADEHLIEHLIQPLQKESVAVSYARQLPKEDAGEVERFTRGFNYPAESILKTKKDLPKLGIKTYFCSDVCAAYRVDLFHGLGGFVKNAIFNEDMLYAAKAIQHGYGIYYAADACVYHSHNYTGMQQLKRNFDMGVSQAQHPEVFANVPSESEGISMVKKTISYLVKKRKVGEIIRLVYLSGCKYIGYRLGKAYQKLPKAWVLKLTSNQAYWK